MNNMQEMIFGGITYNVYTDEERADHLREYCEDNWKHFNRDFLIECMDSESLESFFREVYDESNKSYAEDIETESASSDEFNNRLEEEMAEADVEDVDSFVEWMTDRQIDEGNYGMEHYISNFGKEETWRMMENNIHNFIDFEDMAERAVSADGYAHFLNNYDGSEIEFEFDNETYYAYRA